MPETPDSAGGTQGAHAEIATFAYTAAERAKILSYVKPSKRNELILDRLDLEGKHHLERVKRETPATKAEQETYLRQVKDLSTELHDLLFSKVNIRGTPAEVLYSMRRLWGWNKEHEIATSLARHLDDLATIAEFRLQQRTLSEEEEMHAIRDRHTYLRFEFACRLIDEFQKVNDVVATSWIQETPSGPRHSNAVGFLISTINPVLAALKQPVISVEVAKKEVQAVLRAWANGLHPEGLDWKYGNVPLNVGIADEGRGTDDDSRYREHRRQRGDFAPWEKD